jgi:DNA-binding winged helix-turn-helix (wHTH) protein/tetratricopeptide (TPR) repeat protein
VRINDPKVEKHYAAMCTGCHFAPATKNTEIRAGLDLSAPISPNTGIHVLGHRAGPSNSTPYRCGVLVETPYSGTGSFRNAHRRHKLYGGARVTDQSSGMSATLYRFRNFKLDAQARELYLDDVLVALPVSTLDCLIYLVSNRHRTIGRDELTAAVWGRTEISEVSLSHAIMRLRRVLGDAGNEQNSIRTLPRLGYRWIVEPTSEETLPSGGHHPIAPQAAPVTNGAPDSPRAGEEQPSAITAKPRAGRRTAVLLVLLGLALVVVCALILTRARIFVPDSHVAARKMPAMVLPAQVEASEEWSWLRFGFMDLIATRLRSGKLDTMPSEAVVGLFNAHQLDATGQFRDDSPLSGAPSMLIRSKLALVNGLWNVRLDVHSDGRDLLVEAQAKDIVTAGRRAADELLVRLGRTPPPSAEDDASTTAVELAQHIDTAALTGQLDVATALLGNASEELRNTPDVKLSSIAVEFFKGEYEASSSNAEALLDELPADKDPVRRARALYLLGTSYFRLERIDDADKAFAEAIRLLELQNEPDRLAAAYTGRGVVAGQSQRLEEAAAYFGRARTLHEMSNDAFGVARVDLNLGAVAMDRGLPSSAVPIFEDAAARFERLDTPEALNSALRSLADAQSMLLEHVQALATTDRFWPAESHGSNPREGWWLTLSRAAILADNGRLGDADALVALIRTSSDAVKDAIVRVETEALAAHLALLRGDDDLAAKLASGAMTPALRGTNSQDYAGAWLTRIRALQRSHQLEAAAEQVDGFVEWATSTSSARHEMYALLVQANQNNAEGNQAVALPRYAEALTSAEHLGIPEDIVVVAEPYTSALLNAGRVDEASAIAGRVAPWAEKDMRAAWIQAAVYLALRKPDASRDAFEQARKLAGERRLPDFPQTPLPAPH